MTTENTEVQNTEQSLEQQFTETEQKALDMGWRPKSEFEGPEDEFVDAKEFIARKPLYDKISHQSKEMKNLRKGVEALKEHYSKVSDAAYQKALKELQKDRREALVQGDADAFEKADLEIKKAEHEYAQVLQQNQQPVVPDEPVLNPTFINWKNRNTWYDDTQYMRTYADDVAMKLHARGMQPDDILKEVEKSVRKEFPSKFRNPNKDDAPQVGSSSNRNSSTKVDNYQMTEQEHKVWQTLHRVDPEKFSKEKYIADLKKVKGA